MDNFCLSEINTTTQAYKLPTCGATESSGSPVSVQQFNSSFSVKATAASTKKGGKKQGGKYKEDNYSKLANNVSSSTKEALNSPFMQHYCQWYFNYYGEQFKVPRFNKQDLSVEALWRAVKQQGGSQETTVKKQWAEIGRLFNPPKSMTNVSYHIKRLYERYLLAYEKSVSPDTAMEWRRPPGVKRQTQIVSYLPNSVAGVPSPQLPELASASSSEQLPVEFITKVCCGDEQLVGTVIRLWIKQKEDYETVKVVSYDPKTQAHTIRFASGILNAVILGQHTWSLCAEDEQTKQSKNTMDLPSQELPSQQAYSLQFLTAEDNSQKPTANQSVLNGLQSETVLQSLLCASNEYLFSNHAQNDSLLYPNKLQDIGINLDSSKQLVGIADLSLSQQFPFMTSKVEQPSDYNPLIRQLQSQLTQATARIEELEARELIRQKEQEVLQKQLVTREQQFRGIVDELVSSLREANESRKLAEGAATELRKCFELLVNGGGMLPRIPQ